MKTPSGMIYFDGLCLACSSEINHYRRLKGSEKFSFIDITVPGFQPESHGIDPHQVHQVMHVRDTDGQLHQGVDAFRAIWRELPRYQFMYHLSERKTVRRILELGYKAFVRVRPYLPRKKLDCSQSPYCEIQK
jgi:predicted DCC family thiol-disulfide oxidoreductase YuxK